MIAAVVLAAGAATRFGAPKQQLLLPRVLRQIAIAGIDEVVVVLGAHDFPVTGAVVVRATAWEQGPGASLRAGLRALSSDVEAVIVCLADGPLIAPEAIRRVVAAWESGGSDVVAATYAGVRGHPVCIGRTVWGRIPDGGGRDLDALLVACDDLGDPGDVDTPADLERIEPLIRE